MIEISGKPILHRKMPFGKHQGSGMEAVPMNYLQWLSRTVLDEDHENTPCGTTPGARALKEAANAL